MEINHYKCIEKFRRCKVMEIKQNVNIHNRFDVHIDNIETGEHRKFVGYNIILDQMWTRLCNGYSYFGCIHFGSGVGTPTPDRTSLFNYLGSKSAETEEIIKALPVSSWKRKIVLSPEEFVGATISEVGIGYASGTMTLVTHAMLKDAEGNPISFEKTSTDIVTIYATVFASLVDSPLVKLINLPTNNALLNYLLGSGFPSGTFYLLPGEGYGPSLGSASVNYWSADVPNKKRISYVARFDTDTGNGHVMGLELRNLFRVAFPADGIFEGQHYTNVPIGTGDGVTKRFTIPSKNIDSGTLVVKVDGVATTVTQEKRATYNFDIPGFGLYGTGQDICFSRDGKIVGVVHRYSPYFTIYDISSVFDLSSSTPIERSFSVAPTANQYGYGIAMDEDGSHVFVLSDAAPFLRGYEYVGGTYVPITVPDFNEGAGRIAVSLDGTVLAIGAQNGNTVKVFDKVNGTWVARPDIVYNASSTQLQSLDMSDDGTVIVISSNGTKGIDVYDWVDGAWIRRPDLEPMEKVTVVNCSSDGNTIAYIGTAYNIFVCTWDGSTWVKDAEIDYVSLITLEPRYTDNVFMSRDTNSIVVIVYGRPILFSKKSDGTWDTIGQFGDMGNYWRVSFSPDGSFVAAIANYYLFLHDFKPRTTEVIFNSAPAEGAAITADYKVKGIHKTDQYVIDVSCAIQFGEGGSIENEAR